MSAVMGATFCKEQVKKLALTGGTALLLRLLTHSDYKPLHICSAAKNINWILQLLLIQIDFLVVFIVVKNVNALCYAM